MLVSGKLETRKLCYAGERQHSPSNVTSTLAIPVPVQITFPPRRGGLFLGDENIAA